MFAGAKYRFLVLLEIADVRRTHTVLNASMELRERGILQVMLIGYHIAFNFVFLQYVYMYPS